MRLKIFIAAVGQLKHSPFAELCALYQKRMRWDVSIQEVQLKKNVAPSLLKQEEGKLLRHALPEDIPYFALDERGAALTSQAFAGQLENTAQHSASIGFVLGGADGLCDTLRSGASGIISFGQLTWPHMLARVMLIEQLYRAQQIIAGHPYHREG